MNVSELRLSVSGENPGEAPRILHLRPAVLGAAHAHAQTDGMRADMGVGLRPVICPGTDMHPPSGGGWLEGDPAL